MSWPIDETHEAAARSWVASANVPGCDFPIQNLPFGVFEAGGHGPRIGVAIGDSVFDLHAVAPELLDQLGPDLVGALRQQQLNQLMSIPRPQRTALRRRIFELLRESSAARSSCEPLLVPMTSAHMLLPCAIGDFTDFYASVYHATNVGKLFRPSSPLRPNYKWLPVAYHGRSSSIVADGQNITRPKGQYILEGSETPVFGPTERLDYELEVGFYVSPGNPAGQIIDIRNAEDHIFGVCLLNDWSARDIQSWEYQPLGPFLSKNFATSVSPWVVTMDALAPFRVPRFSRPAGDPPPLPHLDSDEDPTCGAVNITLEVLLSTPQMRLRGLAPARLCATNFREMYWTIAQMLTHHASNGCPLNPGDLLGSGTVSGPEESARGCLLELTNNGAQRLMLPDGETRTFLEDGDEVIFRGYCEARNAPRIGFGECRGRVVPNPIAITT